MQSHTEAIKDGLISEKTLADGMGVCQRTIINWRQKGLLPWFKVGGRVLYRRADVDRVLEERYRRGVR